jgi:hypothetical protein
MQYLLMCCANEAQWAKLPDAEREGSWANMESSFMN